MIRNNFFKNIIPIVIFLMVGIFFSCENDLSKVKEVTATDNSADEHMTYVEMTFTDSGNVRVKMFADKVEKYRDEDNPRTEWPEGVHIIFYDSIGDMVSELKAKHGTLYEKKKVMIVDNNVVLSNYKNERMHTEHLELYSDSLYTDQYAQIIRDHDTIEAMNGLVANTDFTSYQLNQVSMSLYYNNTENKENAEDK